MSKNKLNAFALFMKERRPALEAQGLKFPGGLKDVAIAVDIEWKVLSPQKKDEYRRRAKGIEAVEAERKAKVAAASTSADGSPLDLRMTTFGVTFQELKDKKVADANAISKHNKDLRSMLEHEDPMGAIFVIIHFNTYGYLMHNVYVPAEVALTAFNIEDGIIANYCTLIDPYEIPSGLGIEARQESDRLGVPYPPFDNRCQNYEEIVDILEKFVDQNTHKKVNQRKVYCLTKEMKVVNSCLDWLYLQLDKPRAISVFSFGEAMRCLSNVGVVNRARLSSKSEFQMIDLIVRDRTHREKNGSSSISVSGASSTSSGFIFGPTTSISSRGSTTTSMTSSKMSEWDETTWNRMNAGIFTVEQQVDDFLGSYNFAFDPEIGCPYHFHKEVGIPFCSLNVTNRYAYNMLDVLMNSYQISESQMKLSFHIPDLEHPAREFQRRVKMLKRWGGFIDSEDQLKFDGKKIPTKKKFPGFELAPEHPD